MRKFSTRTAEQGQVLLIIILVMVVSLTVGLSVATRSITNLRVSSEEENSQRAFYAAEVGVERALKTKIVIAPNQSVSIASNETLPDKFSKIENVTLRDNSVREVLLDKLALKDEIATLWLVDYGNPNPSGWPGTGVGRLTFYWGKRNETCAHAEASNTQPAIEVVVIKKLATPEATHYVYDPCIDRRTYNLFSAPSSTTPITIQEVEFAYRATLPNMSEGVLVRVVPLYGSTPIAVSATRDLPVQGRRIESVGSSGGTKHKIVVMQGNPKFPTEFFPYLILSPL